MNNEYCGVCVAAKCTKNASNQGLARQRVTTLPDHHQSRGHAKILESLDWWTFTLFWSFSQGQALKVVILLTGPRSDLSRGCDILPSSFLHKVSLSCLFIPSLVT